MKLKLDESGDAVIESGLPVYIRDDGEEQTHDAGATVAKLKGALDDLETEKKAAREARKSLAAWEQLGDYKDVRLAVSMGDGKQGEESDPVEVGKLKARIDELEDGLKERDAQLEEATIGQAFASSAFLRESLIAGLDTDPEGARKLWGAQVKLEDGRVVVRDGEGKLVYSLKNPGEAADFDEGMRQVVPDNYLKPNGAKGSDAVQPLKGSDGGSFAHISRKSQLTEEQKSAFISEKGYKAFAALPSGGAS